MHVAERKRRTHQQHDTALAALRERTAIRNGGAKA